MKLIFENNESINFSFNESSMGKQFKKFFKHLQHIPLILKKWDNPYYKLKYDLNHHVENLNIFAQRFYLNIDKQKCILQDQEYLNYLHKIYETNFDGNPDWLEFHEHIHIIENHGQKIPIFLPIDYREKAGLLTKKIDPNMLDNLQTSVKKGQVFTCWFELGKTPYNYYLNNEPDNIERICELVKPWMTLRPQFSIALEDFDFTAHKNLTDFQLWWDHYSQDWCKFYNIEKYDYVDMFGISIIGDTEESDKICSLLQQNILPIKVKLLN
jgi:hypothetical protein